MIHPQLTWLTFWKIWEVPEMIRISARAAGGGSRNIKYETNTGMRTKNFSHDSL